ncbi:hypothetical protein B1P95_16390 [Enterococcus faecium]|uniref:Uncharacterized protein n=1 Tax=Enterococcus faecium TaxID=1352 RepID=A0A1S8KII6_ENTFC|nr:hypothetical protein B1P95_16390 [Enterococcus faecium]
MFLWLKTLYRKRAVTWPFIFYTIIWTLSISYNNKHNRRRVIVSQERTNNPCILCGTGGYFV